MGVATAIDPFQHKLLDSASSRSAQDFLPVSAGPMSGKNGSGRLLTRVLVG